MIDIIIIILNSLWTMFQEIRHRENHGSFHSTFPINRIRNLELEIEKLKNEKK